MGRVISYGEKTGYNDGDYLLLDNGSGGTKRIRADRVGIQLDPTLTDPNKAAPADKVKKLDDEITGLKEDSSDLKSTEISKQYAWIRGTIIPATGAYYQYGAGEYCSVTDFIPLAIFDTGTVEIVDGYKYTIFYYDKNKIYMAGENYPDSLQGYWNYYADFGLFDNLSNLRINRDEIGFIKLRMQEVENETALVPLETAHETVITGTTILGGILDDINDLTTDLENLSGTVSSNYSELDGKVVSVRTAFDDFKSRETVNQYEWIRGTLVFTTGAYYQYGVGEYCAITDFIPVDSLSDATVSSVDGYLYTIYYYDKNKSYMTGDNYPDSTQGYWRNILGDFDIFDYIKTIRIAKKDIGYIRLRMQDATSESVVVPLDTAHETVITGVTMWDGVLEDVEELKNNESLYAKLPSANNYGTSGQILGSTGSGTVWMDVGSPSSEQIGIAVSNWMQEHPEDRALIADDSITLIKMKTGALGYVSPEMFGAVGDGTTDDTNAINNCINYCISNGCTFKGTEGKTYCVKSAIEIHQPINVDFNFSKIKYIGTSALSDFIEYGVDSIGNQNTNYFYGIKNAIIDGGNKCDNVLHISGGKGVLIENIRLLNPLVCCLLIDDDTGDTWELTAENIFASATNNSPSGQASYAVKIMNITDSYFSNIVCANGSTAWIIFGTEANANVLNGFHGYSYPSTLHTDDGVAIYGNSNNLSKITIDTPYNNGLKNAGDNNVFNDIFQYNVQGTTGNRVCINDSGDYSTYNGIRVGSDCDTIVKTSAADYLSVSNVCCMGNPNKDFDFVNGSRPTKFVYDNSATTIQNA